MKELPKTRASFLDRLTSGCTDTWEEFCDVYGRAVYEFCRARGLQDADASDICQELSVKVKKQLSEGRHDPTKGKFRAWIFTVARNMAIDRVRQLSKRAGMDDEELARDQLVDETGTASAFDVEYQRQLLFWAAEKVRPQIAETSWHCFWSTAIEGKSAADVARQLGLKVGAVYTAKCRVIARIRALILQLDGFHSSESGLIRPLPQQTLPQPKGDL